MPLHWKGVAKFLGIPDATEEELAKHSVPHDPDTCRFCKQMLDDNKERTEIKTEE